MRIQTTAWAAAFLLVAGGTLAQQQPAPACPNGSTCTYASSGYANGTAGMCVSGACTYCAQGACGNACIGVPSATHYACSRAVLEANMAAAERDRKAAAGKAELARIAEQEKRETNDPTFFPRLSDADLAAYPAKFRGYNARMNAIFADLNISKLDAQAAESAIDEQVAKEQACRATPACINARRAAALQLELCQLTGEIRAMQERIRIEKANPSGVVSLADLHADGATIQRDQAAIDAKAPEFQKAAGKPFAAATMCKFGK